MSALTSSQWRLLSIYGSKELRGYVLTGELPDEHPEVNARIATRCLWENPHMWEYGKWFNAEWIPGKNSYRSGTVYVRRVKYPDGEVKFTVVNPAGRWNDNLTIEEARKHLKAKRGSNSSVQYLDDRGQEQAERQLVHSLSR